MQEPARSTLVWDLPTRLFHGALVGLIALQFATAKFGWLSMEWHYRFGYATLALILFRVSWGFFGSQTSRFVDFVRGPSAVARYARAQIIGMRAAITQTPVDATPSVGHNPLGGWSVLVMLACVLAQAVTGLFSSDGIDEDGPFVERVAPATVKFLTHLHHLGETILLVIIAVHIVAVLVHWLLKRDNLVLPMITGYKRANRSPRLYFVSNWRAVLLMAFVALGIVLLSRFAAA
jgi:cytochrome b